ncbi:MAG: peptide-methionine (R)-S-oxide reductase [Verrucomicrobiales bacterium]|nr:peptide-methionine (R)-S-oxide reductase [Verrucomicrobiales bacterium]
MRKLSALIPVAFLAVTLLSSAWINSVLADEKDSKVEESKKEEKPVKTVEKTEEEWRKTLTPEQYRILREAGTERSHGKVYDEFKKQGAGTYYCAGCDTELFSSNEKFDSHCGWPSFYDPSKAKNVITDTDYILGYPRTEVRCAVCDGHLGHVFEGEGFDTPTDKRYCINGTILKFVPAEGTPEAKKEEEKKDAKVTEE